MNLVILQLNLVLWRLNLVIVCNKNSGLPKFAPLSQALRSDIPKFAPLSHALRLDQYELSQYPYLILSDVAE